jgi:NAD(P)-dependent dehydrogenase (short-subunit alcohol dehydrogenase family)
MRSFPVLPNWVHELTALHLDSGSISGIPAFITQVQETLAEWAVHAAFSDVTEAQFDAFMNVHLKSVFFLTQALVPLMADGGRRT